MNTVATVTLRKYPPAAQARGEFDGGRITEIKPIGFPREGSAVRRVGPLFYWAWASAKNDARIGMHPHDGFEIVSYVLSGALLHRDTLGHKSTVPAGGVQVIQAGSGISHEESMAGGSEFFQIWFEPHLRPARLRKPAYHELSPEAATTETVSPGVSLRRLLGPGAPLQLVTDAMLWEANLDPGAEWAYALPEGRSLAAVVVRGPLNWRTADGQVTSSDRTDFLVAQAGDAEAGRLKISAGESPALVVGVEAPSTVGYPLYPAR
jgi:redox-sensitive bicupin YhaK (pirin superfamily)